MSDKLSLRLVRKVEGLRKRQAERAERKAAREANEPKAQKAAIMSKAA